jgi:CubicO group peptidase (beta-lactamase class C family)
VLLAIHNRDKTMCNTNPKHDQLNQVIVESMERLGVPGVAVGIIHGDDEFSAGFGITNVDHPLDVDTTTLFQVGSITKTMTGTAAMRLVEQGLIGLDTPICNCLPDIKFSSEEITARVTLRHLLTHTGGWIGDYFDDFGRGDDALARDVAKMASVPQLTPLGEVWSYNNAGFNVAGRLIEVITGKTYEEAIKELVFAPLNMARSFFFATEVMIHRFVVGHHLDGEKPVVARPWEVMRATNPVGGVVSDVTDLLRYARFHLGDGAASDGTQLLQPETMALMQSPLVEAGSFADLVGLTWWQSDVGGTRVVLHEGSTRGQNAILALVPDHDFAFAILTNSDPGSELIAELRPWILRCYLGVAEPAVEWLELPADKLAGYAGHYDAVLMALTLRVQDGELVFQLRYKGGFPTRDTPPPPSPLTPVMRLGFYDEDRVIVLDPPMRGLRGEFLRGKDGSIEWFRFEGRLHRPE